MHYAIETLEIEIARLMTASRIVEETVYLERDQDRGYRPNPADFSTKIYKLKEAIKVLQEYQETLPKQEHW